MEVWSQVMELRSENVINLDSDVKCFLDMSYNLFKKNIYL